MIVQPGASLIKFLQIRNFIYSHASLVVPILPQAALQGIHLNGFELINRDAPYRGTLNK